MKRADAQRLLLMGTDDRARTLAIEAMSTDALAPLDCGDSSCRSPLRRHGGMRTNGGCRCSPIAMVVAHVALALGSIDSPSTARYVARDMPEDGP